MPLSVLARLAREGPLSLGELAAGEDVQPQSLTRPLAELRRRELVTSAVDPRDARRRLFAASPEGRAALGEEARRRGRWLAHAIADNLSTDEYALLLRAAELMERLAAAPSSKEGPQTE